MDVRNDAGVRDVAPNVGNNGVGARDIIAGGGDGYIHVYHKILLEPKS